MSSVPRPPPSAHAAAERLAGTFRAVRAQTESLVDGLSAEDCALQSMPDASPLKWHLAHTSWFFETFVLERAESPFRAFRPAYRELFNSYYVALGPRHPRPERGLLSRPPLEEIRAYRADVTARMLAALDAGPDDTVLALVELGCHHEQQHQELMLTDFKHLLSRNPLEPAYRSPVSDAAPTAVVPEGGAWLRFDAGLRDIGHDGAGFCFDNELPRHRAWLDAFELATHPVSNAQVLAFVEEGGYREPRHWLSEGWAARAEGDWQAPLYWRRDVNGWREFTLRGALPLSPHAPACHLSYYEADAIARWAGARLPTESEWEAAAAGQPPAGNLLQQGVLHPRAGSTSLYGDVWQWTASSYAPYPGFRAAEGAVGEYNGKFMVNQYVLRGGSCATPASHIRASYRNFFPAHARWQFSGLRLARDAT